jgi:hypothetical protein
MPSLADYVLLWQIAKRKRQESEKNMPLNKDVFVYSGAKGTRKELAGTAWPVFRDFEVEHGKDALGHEDVFLYAPFRPLLPQPGRALAFGDFPQDDGLKRLYAPLRDVPDLFLRFAGLARKGPLSRDEAQAVMQEWVTTYGVLGIEGVDLLKTPSRSAYRQGRRESLTAFAKAVREAAKCLELYEAANAPGGPDAGVLDRYRVPGESLQQKREWALEVVGNIVGAHVQADCRFVLYRTVTEGKDGGAVARHEQETLGFEWGFGFVSLLGAMYLQMMLYMDGGGEGRRCKRPDCYRLVTFDPPRRALEAGLKKGARGAYRTRRDKKFCSKACAQWWSDNYGDSKKARQKRERQRQKKS